MALDRASRLMASACRSGRRWDIRSYWDLVDRTWPSALTNGASINILHHREIRIHSELHLAASQAAKVPTGVLPMDNDLLTATCVVALAQIRKQTWLMFGALSVLMVWIRKVSLCSLTTC